MGSTPVTVNAKRNLGICETYEQDQPAIYHCYRIRQIDDLSTETVREYLQDVYDRSTEHLTDAEKLNVAKLLTKDVFSKSTDDLGRTNRYSIVSKTNVP